MIIEKRTNKNNNIELLKMALLWIVVFCIYVLVGKYEPLIYWVFNTIPFLNFHTLLEFITIIIYFVIFTITYYTYTKNQRTRLLVFSATFFIIGWLDFFHTMSYNGMQGLFVEASIQRATTYWIVTRLVQSIGLLVAAIIPYNHRSKQKNNTILLFACLITFSFFYLMSYHLDIFPVMFIPGQGLTVTKVYLEYVIISLFILTAGLMIKDFLKTGNEYFRIFIIGVFFAIFAEASFTLYRSVFDTYNFIGHIYKIISGYYLFKGIFLYNLENHFKQLDEARSSLKNYAENLESIIEERTMEIKDNNEKMLLDLEYAKLVQQSLLPPTFIEINNVKFVSQNIPCEKLSGDFYYIDRINEEFIGLVIADVSGHGVSAAMMTIFTERIIKPLYYHGKIEKYVTPAETLSHLYDEFNKAHFPDEMHIVIFNAIYNTTTKVLSYCTGGMNTIPVLFRKTGETELLNKSKGFPICKLGDFFQPSFQESEVHLEKGDRIIFFTDGLTESLKKKNLISKETLMEIMHTTDDLEDIRRKIGMEINTIIANNENDDDITYFIMEV